MDQSDQPGPPPPAKAPKPTKKRHWLAWGIVSLSVAILGGSFVGGWIAANRWSSAHTVEASAPQIIEVPAVPEGVRMPDVRGLTKDGALQVIADTGWDPDVVLFKTEPFAGDPGVVIEQSPSFGVTGFRSITLTVSERARVPQFESRPGAEVIAELRQLGVNVTLAYVYDGVVPAGDVVAIDPPPGELLPTDATVTLSDSGTAAFLHALPEVTGSLSRANTISINGQPYSNSVSTSLRTGAGPSSNIYIIGRHVDQFEAVVGIPDNVRETGGVVHVAVFGDGAELAAVDVAYGQAVALSAVVTGVLRLDIQLSFSTPPPAGQSNQTVALGEARVIGADDEVRLMLGGN
jgi:hypothetical protein